MNVPWICIFIHVRLMGGRVVHIERGFGCFSTLFGDCEALKMREDQFELRAFYVQIRIDIIFV